MNAYNFTMHPSILSMASGAHIKVTCCDNCPLAQIVEETYHTCMNPAAPENVNDGYGQSLSHEDTSKLPTWCPMRRNGKTERVVIMLDESEFFKQ